MHTLCISINTDKCNHTFRHFQLYQSKGTNTKTKFNIGIKMFQSINYSWDVTFKDFWLCLKENFQPKYSKEVLDQLTYLGNKIGKSSQTYERCFTEPNKSVSGKQ